MDEIHELAALSCTLSVTQRHSNRPREFSVRVSWRGMSDGPGSSPDFTSTWKPLQMPRIGRPSRTAVSSSSANQVRSSSASRPPAPSASP